MAILTFLKGSQEKLSPHFSRREMDCPCTACHTTLVDMLLIEQLETMRGLFNDYIRKQAGESGGSPDHGLHITSGYRCQAHQLALKLGGAETAIGRSTHELGQAADTMANFNDANGGETSLGGGVLETLARASGFESVGVGNTFVHVDLRPGFRRWLYSR